MIVHNLQAVLDEVGVDRDVVVGMAGGRLMDSSGVNSLIAHAVLIRGGNGSLAVDDPWRTVERVELTGFAHLFEAVAPPARGSERVHLTLGRNVRSVIARDGIHANYSAR